MEEICTFTSRKFSYSFLYSEKNIFVDADFLYNFSLKLKVQGKIMHNALFYFNFGKMYLIQKSLLVKRCVWDSIKNNYTTNKIKFVFLSYTHAHTLTHTHM